MTDREIEQRLKQEVEACVPDVLGRVMAHCDEQEGQVTVMTKKKNIWLKVGAFAACLALVLGISLFAFSAYNPFSVATVVTLDVNPSIELKLNRDARVLEVNALNEDALQVLSGMELKNTDLNTATNAIIGSLLKNGYLHELANAILISVEDEDSTRGAELQQNLSREVNDLLTAASLNAAVLSQYVNQNVVELSNEYHISHGKAALIQQLLAANPSYSFQELSLLSVQELSLLLDNPKKEVKTVTTTGTVNDSAYIGKDRALALEDAGIGRNEITDLEIDFGYEHGVLVYEVDFDVNATEYEYDIDASTGNILHCHTENGHSHEEDDKHHSSHSSGTNQGAQSSAAADIGQEKAKAIALRHAGVTEAEVSRLHVTSEWDDGRLEYQVEFYVGNVEYEYEISAADGSILDYDKEIDD